MKTLKDRVLDPNANTFKLLGSKFQENTKIVKVHGQSVEIKEILFELKVDEVITLLKSMANSQGVVWGRISPMKEPTETLTHIGLLVVPSKTNTENAY